MKKIIFRNYLKLLKERAFDTPLSPRLLEYGIRFWLEQMEKAVKHCSVHESFLDVGAGTGNKSLVLLKSYFKKGMAVEVSTRGRWKEIEVKYPEITLIKGYLQEIPKGSSHDFILLSEVFEHIPLEDVELFILDLKILLKEDGVIFLTTPNQIFVGPTVIDENPWGHYKHYTFQDIKTTFEKHGFKVIENGYENHKLMSLYHRFYYYFAKWDTRFLKMKRFPKLIHKLLIILSAPIIFMFNLFFLLFSGLAIRSEYRNWKNEKTGETLMITIQKN